MYKKKIIVILGQTSTGKSDFAVKLAKKINGEIISADSRQVYVGMDLSTGKITKNEMSGVNHHLLDIVSPRKIFSANNYKKISVKKINEIVKKNKIPIICGGTGFYIDSLINQTEFPKVSPNLILRNELNLLSTQDLFTKLEKLDKNRANLIDKNNKVRLIRAIEIAIKIGKVPEINRKENSSSKYSVLKIGLFLPDELLKKRIHDRIISRINDGMIDEIYSLHKNGLSWKRMFELGLEQRYVSLYLQNEIDEGEMINKLNTKIWQYAKRQKTWFKRDKDIVWINPFEKKDIIKFKKEIDNFLK